MLFSTNGALTNVGISQLTGNVGTNSGFSTNFGNVNGVINDNNGASALCASDLLTAYNQLNGTVAILFPAPLLGNGQTLRSGVYSIGSATTLNLDLTLDGLGNTITYLVLVPNVNNCFFIFIGLIYNKLSL